jgi:inosine-uridine nucleoside N-ribohydrolase
VPNIYDVLDIDPGALKKAKKVVSMFGSFYKGYGGGEISAEWNVRADINSSRALLNSGANLHLAGLDITDHIILTNEDLQLITMRQSPLTNSLAALYSLWYKHADWAVTPKMFDAVAIGMILWPDLIEMKEAFVSVDDGGFTRIDTEKPPNCSIGISINKDKFLRRMMNSLLEQNFQK